MKEWFYQVMGQEIGPVAAAELKAKVTNGQIQADTMIRRGADGKWLFATQVKGLIPVPDVPAPPPVVTKTPRPMDDAHEAKPARKRDESASSTGTDPERSATRATSATTMALVETESESSGSELAFYDFVGFREAISPALYDAVRQYVDTHGITITQLNRRALAEFIRHPELAGDLTIGSVAVLPQSVNVKSNSDGSQPLDASERDELATFRLTLFNTSPHEIRVEQAEFLPEVVEVRNYDTVATGQHPAIDHTGHVAVPFDRLQAGKTVRFALHEVIAPQTKKDVTVWFHSESKPSFTIATGRLSIGTGNDLALSPSLTIILHGDSVGSLK